MQLSEQEVVRRGNLEAIRKLGIDPYPAPLYPITHQSAEIKSKVEFDEEGKL